MVLGRWNRRIRVTWVLLALAGALASCSSSSSKPTAADVLGQFMSAWGRRDGVVMSALLSTPDPAILTQIDRVVGGLHATVERHAVLVTPSRDANANGNAGDERSARLTSVYRLPAGGSWTVTTTVTLQQRSGDWKLVWSPDALYPDLVAGQRLEVSYRWASRAQILGAGGAPLTSQQPQVVVGVEGSRIKDTSQLTKVLEAAGATATEISSALAEATAHPDYFSQVFTLSRAAYDALGGKSSQLYQVPGTVFQDTTQLQAATAGLEAHLVGAVGQPTAQQLAQLGPAYSASSQVGLDGLEAYYQKQLAGTPGATVEVVDGSGRTVSSKVVSSPVAGSPVTTTIDPSVQQAAESALSSVKLSTKTGVAALVAVDVSTGKVLASVSLPAGTSFDYALDGEFPPGSTFKILTSTALFDAGLSPSSPASCPQTVTVDGEVFHNAEGESPVTTLGQAFTESCNTAFIQLATAHLQASSFTSVAALYGLGRTVKMGYPAFAGSVPSPSSRTALAASAIGQASVVVSPLNMAEVAAAVGSGTFHPARLVQGAPDDSAAGNLLPATAVSSLRTMMKSVVESPSGTAAGTGLPEGTYAKTGTSQYGSGNPLPIDAWLAGYDGNVAFAMVQQDSKLDGGPADGPVVAKFLDSLPASVVSGGA